MIVNPSFNRHARSPGRCLVILFMTIAFMYVIVANIVSNYEKNQECYRIMKQMDLRNGRVHNLMKASLGGMNKTKDSASSNSKAGASKTTDHKA